MESLSSRILIVWCALVYWGYDWDNINTWNLYVGTWHAFADFALFTKIHNKLCTVDYFAIFMDIR